MIKTECLCGHDRETHFEDHGVRVNCLGRGCDCKSYKPRYTHRVTPIEAQKEKRR